MRKSVDLSGLLEKLLPEESKKWEMIIRKKL